MGFVSGRGTRYANRSQDIQEKEKSVNYPPVLVAVGAP
jgi:hypothetical protein